MQNKPPRISRRIRALTALTALAALSVVGGGVEARANSELGALTLEAAPGSVEARIQTLIRDWFAVLEDPTAEAEALNGLLVDTPFEFVRDDGTLLDRGALLAWVANLRAAYPQIDYRLGSVDIQAEAPDHYRVRFEFDRHALDEAGIPHVARREHTWWVRSDSNAKPAILKIEERPLLFFSGSGPRIICY